MGRAYAGAVVALVSDFFRPVTVLFKESDTVSEPLLALVELLAVSVFVLAP
jgi:hypothetical protein